MDEQEERVEEKSESKTRKWWEKEQSQYEGTQNRERKGQIMGCRALVCAAEAIVAHGALGSPRETKTQGNIGPQTIPFGPLGSQMQSGKTHRERRETAHIFSSAAATSPHISTTWGPGH